MRCALITGIAGQDGSYLAELLLEKGYKVFGIEKDQSYFLSSNLTTITNDINPIIMDLASVSARDVEMLIQKLQPNEIYNLAALSSPIESWGDAANYFKVNTVVVAYFLDAINKLSKNTRFFQAASSEMFGDTRDVVRTEITALRPNNPYSISKAAGYYIIQAYRHQYGLFAVSGIAFNHESVRRTPKFVSRKITLSVARVKMDLESQLKLGNLEAERDWGFAPDYVEAMWLMLQNDTPEDFIIATGETHSVKEFCQLAFDCAGLDWKKHVISDSMFVRSCDTNIYPGDSSKIKNKLGWQPRVDFKTMVRTMVKHDLAALKKEGNQ